MRPVARHGGACLGAVPMQAAAPLVAPRPRPRSHTRPTPRQAPTLAMSVAMIMPPAIPSHMVAERMTPADRQA